VPVTCQGASADEIQQHLYSCSLKDVVKDDPRGFATLFPGANPDLPDISSTPNRLLHKLQDKVRPSKLLVLLLICQCDGSSQVRWPQ
jgi:hypothetical protein